MKKMIMIMMVIISTIMVGCGTPKQQETAYVRAYDEETGETLGYIAEVDGKIYIIADTDNSEKLVEMVQNEINNINN